MNDVDIDTTPGPGRARTGRRRVDSGQERADATRGLLLRTAERLYAERGLFEVSNRQILETAGQNNNSALAYHVGSRADLIRAIAASHQEPIARRTRELMNQTRGSTDPRDYVACLVLPYTEHLAELGNPSWYARLSAQLAADPAFGDLVLWDPPLATLIEEALTAIWSWAPALPPAVATIRRQTMRVAVLYTCAEQERDAARTGIPADWVVVGDALTDTVTGLLLAPVRDAAVRQPEPPQGEGQGCRR